MYCVHCTYLKPYLARAFVFAYKYIFLNCMLQTTYVRSFTCLIKLLILKNHSNVFYVLFNKINN